MEEISWKQFEQVQLRAGTIIEVSDFPEARKPAYKLTIDFGAELGTRKSSAQITKNYTRETLIGRQVIAVINFPKKQVANFMSECLVTGFADEHGDIILAGVAALVPDGARLI